MNSCVTRNIDFMAIIGNFGFRRYHLGEYLPGYRRVRDGLTRFEHDSRAISISGHNAVNITLFQARCHVFNSCKYSFLFFSHSFSFFTVSRGSDKNNASHDDR